MPFYMGKICVYVVSIQISFGWRFLTLHTKGSPVCCSFREDSGIPTIHVTTLSLSASVSQPYLHTEASAPLFLPLSVSSLLHEPDTAARNHAYELYTIPVVDTPHILAHHWQTDCCSNLHQTLCQHIAMSIPVHLQKFLPDFLLYCLLVDI